MHISVDNGEFQMLTSNGTVCENDFAYYYLIQMVAMIMRVMVFHGI
ncbi:conserved hypothetical protein [Trichinella spiralis]|nr:conserved hypothetical protein [Trichinella spiralis]